MEFEVAPEYGSVTVAGRTREMEDVVRVCTELCRSDITGCKSVHFFAVFDGLGFRRERDMKREESGL